MASLTAKLLLSIFIVLLSLFNSYVKHYNSKNAKLKGFCWHTYETFNSTNKAHTIGAFES